MPKSISRLPLQSD